MIGWLFNALIVLTVIILLGGVCTYFTWNDFLYPNLFEGAEAALYFEGVREITFIEATYGGPIVLVMSIVFKLLNS